MECVFSFLVFAGAYGYASPRFQPLSLPYSWASGTFPAVLNLIFNSSSIIWTEICKQCTVPSSTILYSFSQRGNGWNSIDVLCTLVLQLWVIETVWFSSMVFFIVFLVPSKEKSLWLMVIICCYCIYVLSFL